jgi:hypothetical protein
MSILLARPGHIAEGVRLAVKHLIDTAGLRATYSRAESRLLRA